MNTDRYLTIRLEHDTIYMTEERYGIEIEKVRLNQISRITFMEFHEFFNKKHKLMPIILKNENRYLAILKELLPMEKPIKGMIQKITDEHILIDVSISVAGSTSFRVTDGKKLLPDIRALFKDV